MTYDLLLKRLSAAGLAGIVLSACVLGNSPVSDENPSVAVQAAAQVARGLLQQEADEAETVLLVDGRYVGNAVVSGPEWMGQWIEFRADAVTANQLIDLACLQMRQRCLIENFIEREGNAGPQQQQHSEGGQQSPADRAAQQQGGQGGGNRIVPTLLERDIHYIQHSGTVAQLLHRIEALTGKSYVVDANGVLWTDELVEIFDVSYLPGAVSFTLGNESEGAGAGGGGGQQQLSQTIQAIDSQSLEIDGSTTPWDELTSVIDVLTGTGANVYLDQANSQLIVSGNRAHIAKARTLVSQLNDKFTRQVVIDVALVQLDLQRQQQLRFRLERLDSPRRTRRIPQPSQR